NAFFDLNESTKVRHVADASFDDAAHAIALIDGSPRIRLELLQPERNASLPGVDLENNGLHLVPGLYDFGGMFHAPRPGHFTDVNQTLDAGLQLDERAVVGHVDHAADHPAVYRVALHHGLPRIGFELLNAQRDALLGPVELQHLDRDLLPDLQ